MAPVGGPAASALEVAPGAILAEPGPPST